MESKEKEGKLGIVPKGLFPLFLSFALDSISVGLIIPLLPYFAMELGANAFQLSLVISSNYMAQVIGCIIMGSISDLYGRKIVILLYLFASSTQYILMANSKTLVILACSRVLAGIFGGLIPIMQSCVSDVVQNEIDRTKYLGRITATFGVGFVLGPVIGVIVQNWNIRNKILTASLFPFLGFFVSLFWFKETNKLIDGASKSGKTIKKRSIMKYSLQKRLSKCCKVFLLCFSFGNKSNSLKNKSLYLSPSLDEKEVENTKLNLDVNENVSDDDEYENDENKPIFPPSPSSASSPSPNSSSPSLPPNNSSQSQSCVSFFFSHKETALLVLNGFLTMYAFSTDSVYALLLRDSLSLGPAALSLLTACSGFSVILFQLSLATPLAGRGLALCGGFLALFLGDLTLGVCLAGLALLRSPLPHFALFLAHVLAFSLADTTTASLVSHTALPQVRGRALALLQSAQALARVVSPLAAGILYQRSQEQNQGFLPRGSLPFVISAIFPILGSLIPMLLYWWSLSKKTKTEERLVEEEEKELLGSNL